jgi:predicted HAD superfamily Cof-like phosphohydrolase
MHATLFSVGEFHQKMGQKIGDPANPDVSVDSQLRWDLIHEEFQELTLALQGKDKHGNTIAGQDQIVAVADALGDMVYVIAGAAIAWGIDLGGVMNAIHDSNMTKEPSHKRADGKILKGPNYQPPKIAEALQEAAQAIQVDGYGDDSWWPEPTGKGCGDCSGTGCVVDPTVVNPATEGDLLKDCKCVAVLKSIEHDASFFMGGYVEPATETITAPNVDKLIEAVERKAIQGQFLTSRPAYSFDCPKCDRTHEVATREGTRGGAVGNAHTECRCGLSFDLVFSGMHAEITVHE